ncbi:MAG: hypothetical protein H6622_13220 [Halobacteriovoraceae bacterium]|nr:hypothetical protein [Halobacteriovoraceae bacterium]
MSSCYLEELYNERGLTKDKLAKMLLDEVKSRNIIRGTSDTSDLLEYDEVESVVYYVVARTVAAYEHFLIRERLKSMKKESNIDIVEYKSLTDILEDGTLPSIGDHINFDSIDMVYGYMVASCRNRIANLHKSSKLRASRETCLSSDNWSSFISDTVSSSTKFTDMSESCTIFNSCGKNVSSSHVNKLSKESELFSNGLILIDFLTYIEKTSFTRKERQFLEAIKLLKNGISYDNVISRLGKNYYKKNAFNDFIRTKAEEFGKAA